MNNKKKKKYQISKKNIENLKYLRDQLIDAEKKMNIKDINTCKNMLNKCLDDIIINC
jgi:16S rRNA G527 N7-methylase RsmG